jgi:hypothetical protein
MGVLSKARASIERRTSGGMGFVVLSAADLAIGTSETLHNAAQSYAGKASVTPE